MQLIRSIAVASFVMFSFAACATEESTTSDDVEVFDPKTSTVDSELAACQFDGGCTNWNSDTGCSQVTCCTVCGGGYKCMDFATYGGGDECVFYPRRF